MYISKFHQTFHHMYVCMHKEVNVKSIYINQVIIKKKYHF